MLVRAEELDGLVVLLAALRSIGATLERGEIIEHGLRAIIEQLGCRRARLDLDAEPEVIEARSGSGGVEVARRARSPDPGFDDPGFDAQVTRVELRREGRWSGHLWVEGGGPAWVLDAIAAQLVVALDNAEQHARLRADEQRVWSILDNSNSLVFIKDLDGRYVLVNRQFEIDTGLSRGQVLGRDDHALFDEPTVTRIQADDREVIETGEPREFEGVTQFPSGPRVFLTTKFPLRDSAGRIYAVCGIAKDISARRQAEHSHRLDALGQLAGGIAHDFNNMLAAMLGGAELIGLGVDDLEDALPADALAELREAVAMIVETGERAAELTRELLAFSYEGHRETEDVDVHAVIRSMVTLLSRSIDRRVDIELDLRAHRSWVRGNSTRLQAALLHLGVNACDAMAGGGRLKLSTRDVELDADACARAPFAIRPGSYVEISIQDTTKAGTHATGLGLVVVRGSVVEHGGSIDVHSEVGVGTEVVVRLPAVERTPPAVFSPIEHTPSGALVIDERKPKILLVDDERTVRKTGGYLLEALGFEVVLAADGQEGVDRFREHHESLDLVLLDMTMPRLGGAEAFARMREIDASVPVVVCSGYAAGETVERLRAQGLAGFLAKPYRRQQLVEAIERVLAGNR